MVPIIGGLTHNARDSKKNVSGVTKKVRAGLAATYIYVGCTGLLVETKTRKEPPGRVAT